MSNFNQEINKNFFYCGDEQCKDFLVNEKKIRYLCDGLNINTKKEFYLFQRTEKLTEALDEFHKLIKK